MVAAETKCGSRSDAGNRKAGHVDQSAVFIRGLPKGTADNELRTWLEGRIGPTVTCFVIRDDYGLAKFKNAADARRCFEELQGTDFQGAVLKMEAAKPKRQASGRGGGAGASAATGEAAAASKRKRRKGVLNQDAKDGPEAGALAGSGEQDPEGTGGGMDLRSVQLLGVPSHWKKEAIDAWVKERLPGGCGLECVRRVLGHGEVGGSTSGASAVVLTFRKELNASRAVEVLQGSELEGSRVVASYRALELSRSSSKAGRLIIRNLAFGATAKHVRKAFESVGAVLDVHLPSKPGSEGQHRGFAFVQYEEATTAERAIEKLNGSKVCGRGVAVDWAVDSQLYVSLQREEQHHNTKQQKGQATEASTGKKRERPTNDEDEDDDEDEEEEECEDEEGDGEHRQHEDADGELQRMRKLLDDKGGGNEDEDEGSNEEHEDDGDGADEENKPGKAKERKPGFDVEDGRTVFVRNVPFDASEEDLRGLFKQFGRVTSVKFVADKTGQNAHRGSCFVKFAETSGCLAALSAEADADRKLKELSAVVRKSDQRELPAVEGFGISLKGRRLVVKEALTPEHVDKLGEERQGKKGNKKEEKRAWMHLLNVGRIDENSEHWSQLSKSEQRQRLASAKERKFRVNNPNWVLDPLRLSVRNLPRSVDAVKLREVIVKHLGVVIKGDGASRKEKMSAAQSTIQKVSLVRDSERRVGIERRSKGFGFIAFKDHHSAMKTLEFLNDNPAVFGGGRRPIVEFAVEDKRKLRMQQELHAMHAHKLKPVGKKNVDDAEAQSWMKPKKKKKPGESRGRKQREKRRAQRATEAEKAARQQTADAKWEKAQVRRAEEKSAQKAMQPKRPKKRDVPDAGLPSAKRLRRAVGQLPDDFELRAMDRFRR